MRFLIRAVSASLHSADLRLLTVSAVVRRRTFSAWCRPEISLHKCREWLVIASVFRDADEAINEICNVTPGKLLGTVRNH